MKKLFFFAFIIGACTSLTPFQKEISSYWKTHQEELYMHDRAPIKKHQVKDLRYYKANPAYNFEAVFARFDDGEPFEMATVAGITKTYSKYGSLIFKIDGKEIELAVYQSERLKKMEEYKDYLFLPFKDMTSAVETYGGGRYLDLSRKDIKNGKVELDFNKAYNPWCAYSEGYSCPIPPTENHLSIAIKAGEKTPVNMKH